MICILVGSQLVQISGSTVLLTGATGGIGHAIARALHERGGQLILTGRRTEVLEPLAAELGARTLAVDLSDPAEIDRLIAEAGEVDILVANAALPASGRLETFTMQEIDRALDVNLRAPIALAHALLPAMIARRSGHLLFMSSLAGKAATPGTAIYNAAKFGLRGFASALRADLRAKRRRRLRDLPRLHPRRRHVRRRRCRASRRASARAAPRTSPAQSSRRSSATAPRSTSRPSPCASARSSPASRPSRGDVARKLGSEDMRRLGALARGARTASLSRCTPGRHIAQASLKRLPSDPCRATPGAKSFCCVRSRDSRRPCSPSAGKPRLTPCRRTSFDNRSRSSFGAYAPRAYSAS